MNLVFVGLSVMASLMICSCQEPPPPKPEPYPNSSLALEAVQVNSIDVALQLSLSNLDSLTGDTLLVILARNGQHIQTLNFIPPDTILWDTGLEPERNYNYKAYRQSVHNSSLVDSSNALSVTTLDTTSHDFIWTIDTLGSYGSYFMDVAIIDENNIWAVGNIVAPDPDSSFNGTGWREYNAARWNGDEWELMGIYSSTLDLYAIWYIAEDDIWVLGSYPIHWNGEDWTQYHLTNMGIIPGGLSNGAIWGSASDDVYFVGGHGRIVHFDGSGFTRLESGTDLDLHDIWGGYNTETNVWEILCVGSDFLNDPEYRRVILKIEGNTFTELSSAPITGTLYSTWFIPGRVYYVAGAGEYRKNKLTDPQWVRVDTTNAFYSLRIRGSAINNVFKVGGYFNVGHYNGLTWKKLNLNIPYSGNFYGLDVKDGIVAFAGETGGPPVFCVGKNVE